MYTRRDEMDVIDERALVYMAVLFVCSALAVFAGPARALATFGLVAASVEGAYWVGNSLAARYRASIETPGENEGRIAMRIHGSARNYSSMVSRANAFGVALAGALLVTGCGMVTVVSEQAVSDYALCIDKREAGGVAPEVAALNCMDVTEIATTGKL